jgi:hypothetical protein
MEGEFSYDVFLCHSAKDQMEARAIAERLRKDGLKVWFDEWEIRPTDMIPAKVEEGLERSRTLLLCVSANALGMDWTPLEAQAARFRDPANHGRRFVSVRLDGTPPPGSMAEFLCVNWLPEEREREYARLLKSLQVFEVRITWMSSSVRREGADFRYHLEIEGLNASNHSLVSSGLVINVPMVDSLEKLGMVRNLEVHGTNDGAVRRVGPGGNLWEVCDDGVSRARRSRCLLVEITPETWWPQSPLRLSITMVAPWPRVEFYVRAWGNIPDAKEQRPFGDPDLRLKAVRDQQGIPTYVVAVGF